MVEKKIRKGGGLNDKDFSVMTEKFYLLMGLVTVVYL